MKHRYRFEDGQHIATIELDGERLDARECGTKEEALALRDAASLAGASSFEGIEGGKPAPRKKKKAR